MQGAKGPQNAANSSASGGKKPKPKKRRRSIPGMILSFIGCLLCVCVMVGCVGAVALSMYVVQVTASDDLDLDNLEFKQTTIVYDQQGNEVTTFSSGDSNRIWRNLSDMPENLQHAFIAVEDKNFYQESLGINVKRTIGAVLNEVAGGRIYGGTQGASTFEQQLVKNLTGDNAQDYMRKVREIFRAIGLANRYSKETVLEAYLNTVPLTGIIQGVEAGANEYFGKSVEELTLAECATLASISKNPTNYNPFTNPEMLMARRNHVLALMAQQGYITEEECAAAQNETVVLAESKSATENSTRTSNNSYFDDALFEALTEDIMETRNLTRAEAQEEIFTGGLKVYATVDTEIQEKLEQLMLNEPDEDGNELFPALWHEEEVTTSIPVGAQITYDENTGLPLTPDGSAIFGTDDLPVYEDEAAGTLKTGTSEDGQYVVFYENVRTQAAMVVMDYEGNILAVGGGIGEKKVDRGTNRATIPHQTGSTMKPIAAYSLALDRRLITYSTPLSDTPYYDAASKQVLKSEYSYLNPYDPATLARSDVWRSWPENYNGMGGNGEVMLVYDALRQSFNTIAVWVGSMVGADNMFDFAHDTLNCTHLDPETDVDLGPMVLGSQSYGLTTVELAGAYTMFWDGTFTTPHYYTRVEDSDGNTYLDNSTRITTTEAIKPTTATIMVRLLQNVLYTSKGTAYGMAPEMDNGMMAAAKTGTTSDFRDYTFVGLTPYYVTAVWWGFDTPASMYDYPQGKNGKPTQYAWKYLMEDVQADLPLKEFPVAEGVVEKQFDPNTGAIVSSGGMTGYYTEDNLPSDDYATTESDEFTQQAQAAAEAAQSEAGTSTATAPATDSTTTTAPSTTTSTDQGSIVVG